MKLPFTIQEFCITRYAVPQRVANSILHDHILTILPFRLEKGYPVTASMRSGYRPISWELAHGRSGKSQHTFPKRKGKTGAVDWTCVDHRHNEELLDFLIHKTDYTRIAVNRTGRRINYIHCDYKPVDRRQLFRYNKEGRWVFVSYI